MNEIKEYWQGLQPRERLLLVVGGAFLLVFLVYSLYLKPFYTSFSDEQARLNKSQTRVANIERALTEAETLKGNGQSAQPTINSSNVLSTLESTASTFGIKPQLKKIQPVGDNRIDIRFEEVGFEDWLNWNQSITEQGVITLSVGVTKANEYRVNIRQTLQTL